MPDAPAVPLHRWGITSPEGNDAVNDASGSAHTIGRSTPPAGAPGGSYPVDQRAQVGPPLPNRPSNSGLVLLIVAGLSTAIGLLIAAPAVILAILAMANQQDAPSRAARLARWGWIVYAIAMALMVAAAAILIGFAVYAASGS